MARGVKRPDRKGLDRFKKVIEEDKNEIIIPSVCKNCKHLDELIHLDYKNEYFSGYCNIEEYKLLKLINKDTCNHFKLKT